METITFLEADRVIEVREDGGFLVENSDGLLCTMDPDFINPANKDYLKVGAWLDLYQHDFPDRSKWTIRFHDEPV